MQWLSSVLNCITARKCEKNIQNARCCRLDVRLGMIDVTYSHCAIPPVMWRADVRIPGSQVANLGYCITSSKMTCIIRRLIETYIYKTFLKTVFLYLKLFSSYIRCQKRVFDLVPSPYIATFWSNFQIFNSKLKHYFKNKKLFKSRICVFLHVVRWCN